MASKDIKIIKSVGSITASVTGWQKELNVISQEDGSFAFDLREWSLDHSDAGEGISFGNDEAKVLLALLKECFKDGEDISINTIPIPTASKQSAKEPASPVDIDETIYPLLKEKNIEYIDKRANGGALWITGGHELDSIMETLIATGYKFIFSEKGGKQTKGKPGWYLRNS